MKPFSLLALTCLVTACGNGALAEISEQEVALTVSGVTSEPELAALGDSQGGLGIERAALRVSAITLSACRESTADLTLGARTYDLLSEPRSGETVLTAVNELCRLRVDVDAGSPDDAGALPDDASLFVAGADAEGEPVSWTSQSSYALVFDAAEGESFGREPLLLGFDLATWLESLPELDAEDAALQFEAQLVRAAALYVDADGDRELDEDERTPIARAAN
jgi:hypothetical protein